MLNRILISILVVAIVIFASSVVRNDLKENETKQIARIAESESYAARSRLVRNVDTMLRALQNAHVFWSKFGSLPRDQWNDDASMELSHFKGVELILWSDPDRGLRFARKVDNPVFDYRPDDEEWAKYNALLAKAEGMTEDRILGPFIADDGTTTLEVFYVPRDNRVDGTLIAVIDTRKALRHTLEADSPGFTIEIRAGEDLIFQRGEPDENIPENWIRSGKIRNIVGTIWEVTHTPTPEFAASMQTPAIDGVLYAGIAIAVLMGLLLVESGRSSKRARSAMLAKARLARLNEELEQQVADRTLDLEERSRDLVTITDSVGHDLRNPLNSISANLQLLEQQYQVQLGDTGLEILEKMSAGVRQMVEILDRLLSLSTVAVADFEREQINLTELAREIFEELQVSEPGPTVDFFAEDVPDAMGEPVMVQVLILNLLSNAFKYTRSKSDRKVIFSYRMIDGKPAYYVQDNGIGFSSEMSEKLFEAFERLHEDHQVEGLGLGLDIASRVVRRHQGKIWAEGQPDKGATFYFTLGEEGVVD